MNCNQSNDCFGDRLELLMNLIKVNEDLSECEVKLNSVSVKTSENVLNICNNNCVKMCRISTECKALIENHIKCRYNKQFNCFWPKCRFTANYESNLNYHISQHSSTNRRQFKCNECNQTFL